MQSNVKSARKGGLSKAHSRSAGHIAAAQSTFSRFSIFQSAAFSAGFFVSTDRVDADPTDKG
jgi:hypothetical protein